MKKIYFIIMLLLLLWCNNEKSIEKNTIQENSNSWNSISTTKNEPIQTTNTSSAIETNNDDINKKRQELVNLLKQNAKTTISQENTKNSTWTESLNTQTLQTKNEVTKEEINNSTTNTDDELTQEELDIAENASDENIDKLIDVLFDDNNL